MEKEKTIYLIDGTAYIYRAYHAIRSLSNSRGLPTNAVYGFTRMLIKLMEDRSPEYIAMFFDAKGSTFRHEMYADYKANRPPMPEDMVVQLPYIKEVTAAFNLPIMEMAGFEADDLIGTVARQAEKAGYSVVIVTGDKDFMQLVSDRTIIWDPMKENIISPQTIEEKFGIEPRQMIDVQGLSGDTADNIPGVPGIGQKTAISLIKSYHSMEGVYEKLNTITRKKLRENLENFKDQAFLSRKLVTIQKRAPLTLDPKKFKVTAPKRDKLAELFKQLEFRQLQQAFPEQADLSHKDYQAVMTLADLEKLISRLESVERFALDTETTSTNPMQAELVGLSFAICAHQAFYIPCAHNYLGAPDQLNLNTVLNRLKPVLENPAIEKIGQNIKYDWMVLSRYGIDLAGVAFDTMLASYLLDPSKRAHNLDQIALDFLGHKAITFEQVAGKGKHAVLFSQVALDQATPYACEDADITLMAYEVLNAKLKDLDLDKLMATVEMPLVPVLLHMEMRGTGLDLESLTQLSRSFRQQLDALEGSIYGLAGETFNINSSQQLGRILFDKLKLPIQKKTKKKTGYSTDVNVLTTLAEYHELPALILKHRTLAKLKSTYTDALIELVNPKTGRIHTSYNQTVTATGRLSSSDPNLQNIPIRTEEGRKIRRAFIPQRDWHLVSADYSQVELRILAHYSEDEILMKAFAEDEDIHTRTACEVFQISAEALSDELRRQAKAINFGIIYGMSAFGLSKQLEISRKMAQTFIDQYFQRYSGVKRFLERTIAEARDTRQTSTLLGRIRILSEINSRNHIIRQAAERTAINTPIQGSAADLIKVAMIQVSNALREKDFKSAMLLTVHDELVFEVPPDELKPVSRLVRKTMEGVWKLKVPLKINISHGQNWDEAH
ncbi:MAG: DNA polymerase I [Desulfobacterales bacterium]